MVKCSVCGREFRDRQALRALPPGSSDRGIIQTGSRRCGRCHPDPQREELFRLDAGYGERPPVTPCPSQARHGIALSAR